MDILTLNLEHSDKECPINNTFSEEEDSLLQKCSRLTFAEVLDKARHSIIDQTVRHVYDGESSKISINVSDIILIFNQKVKEVLGTSEFSESRLYAIGLYAGRTIEKSTVELDMVAATTLSMVKLAKIANISREKILDGLISSSGSGIKRFYEKEGK